MTPGCTTVCRWWHPIASHHLVPSLFLHGLSLPPYSPFLSVGRLCQRSPGTVPVSLFCVGPTWRRATALAIGQLRPSGQPIPAVWEPFPTAAFGLGCPLVGSLSQQGLITTFNVPVLALSPACGERILCPPVPGPSTLLPWCVYRVSLPSRGMGAIRGDGWGWCGSRVMRGDGVVVIIGIIRGLILRYFPPAGSNPHLTILAMLHGPKIRGMRHQVLNYRIPSWAY